MAKSVSLSDQMGAMAIVDELHHREMELRELLDAPKMIDEVKRKLVAYYESRGAAISESLIDEGVRLYFDGRMRFEPPKLTKIQSWLAEAWLARALVGRIALSTGLVLAATGVMASIIFSAYNNVSVSRAKEQVSMVVTDAANLNSGIAYVNNAVGTWRKSADIAIPSIDRFVTKASDLMVDVKPVNVADVPDVDSVDKEAVASWIKSKSELIKVTSAIKSDAVKQLDHAGEVRQMNQRLQVVLGSVAYARYGKSSDIQKAREVAEERIRNAGLPGVLPVFAVTELENLVATADARATSAARLENLAEDFKAMGLSGKGKAMVDAEIMSARLAIEKGLQQDLTASMYKLSLLKEYAMAEVQVSIVDVPGKKSGVERTHHETNGKAWYVVVESLDSAWKAVQVPYRNAENGTTGFTSIYAVRVPQSFYEQVKQDKKSDGRVDDKVIGTKKANSLDVQYLSAIDTPDIITEW